MYNVDVIGVLRGKYLTPAFAVKLGESAIRKCLRDQLKFLRDESLEHMGAHPLIFTEIGIPYDMDDKHAYKTGDYSGQISAMDANHFALEGSTANGFTLWLYMTQVSACRTASRASGLPPTRCTDELGFLERPRVGRPVERRRPFHLLS